MKQRFMQFVVRVRKKCKQYLKNCAIFTNTIFYTETFFSLLGYLPKDYDICVKYGGGFVEYKTRVTLCANILNVESVFQ